MTFVAAEIPSSNSAIPAATNGQVSFAGAIDAETVDDIDAFLGESMLPGRGLLLHRSRTRLCLASSSALTPNEDSENTASATVSTEETFNETVWSQNVVCCPT